MAVIDHRLIDPFTQQDVTENLNRIMKRIDAVTPVSGLSLTSTGKTANTTTITVSPSLESGNSYYFATGTRTLPMIGTTAADLTAGGYAAWNGSDAIGTTSGRMIYVVEFSAAYGAVKGGSVAAVVTG